MASADVPPSRAVVMTRVFERDLKRIRKRGVDLELLWIVELGASSIEDLPRHDHVFMGIRWSCTCGSPNCRRRHRSGFFDLPMNVQARYFALLDDWVLAEHPGEVAALKRWIAR